MSVGFTLYTVLPAIVPFDVLRIMMIVIVLSGVLAVVTAGYVAHFPERNRMYEVFGLFALLPVGIVLMNDNGHPGSSSYRFYFMGTSIFYTVPVI